jgi:DNA-binding LytR/AlgR family response regulator
MKKELEDKGFEVVEQADYVFKEVKNKKYVVGLKNNENVLVHHKDVIYFEAIGREVIAHTINGEVVLSETLRSIELLNYDSYLKVHRSFIVNIDHIKSISLAFNSKYKLKLTNGFKIEVSRTYYYIFKETIGL